MIWLWILLGYSGLGIFTSRWLYGGLRTKKIAEHGLAYWNASHGDEAFAALMGGFVWPIMWVCWVIYSKPPVTPQEKELRLIAEKAADRKHIQELEEENERWRLLNERQDRIG